MRIVIDIQGAQGMSRYRGIGRYCLNFAQSIVRNKRNHEIFLALNGFIPETVIEIRKAFAELLPQDHIRVWEAPAADFWSDLTNAANRQRAQTIYANFIASLQPDLLLATSVIDGYTDNTTFTNKIPIKDLPIAIVEYDLIPYTHPKLFLHSKTEEDWYYDRLRCIEEAQLVLSISQYSRTEFIEQLGADPSKVIAIGTDASSDFYREKLSHTDIAWLKEHGLNRPFILYTGGGEDRKNTDNLLRAFNQLPSRIRKKYQLAIACGINVFRIKVLQDLAARENIPLDDVVFFGYLSTTELRRLYNACHLFVFPSLYEGFGLTPLEAMRCGAAVIGSNTTSIPEVIGYEEALFDPYSVESITQKMAEVLSDDDLWERLKGHALNQSKKFSWDITANTCLDAIEKAIPASATAHPAPLSPQQNIDNTIDALAPLLSKNLNLAQIAYDLALTFDPPDSKRQKTLFVDISELVQRDARTGIQRVVRSLLLQLLITPPTGYTVKPVYATMDSYGYKEARRFTHSFLNLPPDHTIQDRPIEYHYGDFFLGLDFQASIVPAQALFIDQMAAHGVNTAFVIYDLLPIQFPKYFVEDAEENHTNWLRVISRSDSIICISKAVADEYFAWFEKNKPFPFMPQTHWFHLGCDIAASAPTKGLPDDAKQALTAMCSHPTFLMVSTIEPRKGHAQTLKAFERLWKQGADVNLVIVGKKGWNMEHFVQKLDNHRELGKRLFWLKSISDEYLEKVYDAACAVIMASEGEGFGLAIVEGARHGKPLILRDIPVFREIAQDHAFYFKGLTPEALAEAIEQWLALYKQGLAPASSGIESFTWEESAKMLISKLPLK